VPRSTWGPGTSWSNGLRNWGRINVIIPATMGHTTPSDFLITVADYTTVPGAMAWASVSPDERIDNIEVLIAAGLVALSAFAEGAYALIREYAYANKVAQTLKFIAQMNVTAAETAAVGDMTGIAILNEEEAGV
jgi:hypothetical protein